MRRILFCLLVAAALGLPSSGAGGGERILTVLRISNRNAKPVLTSFATDVAHRYRISVKGEISDWTTNPNGIVNNEKFGVDALYCYAKWRCGAAPQLWRQLRISDGATESACNHVGLDELARTAGQVPYNPRHVYEVLVDELEGRLCLGALDALAGSAGDNTGTFVVTIVDLGLTRNAQKHLDVTFRGKTYLPARATIANDASVRFCNRDPFWHAPIYLSKAKFDVTPPLRRLRPGGCYTVRVHNKTGKNAVLKFFDEIHSQERIVIVVLA